MEISIIENNNTICTAYFERYEEDILNGAYPVLKEGLIPININEENGSVTRASTTDTQNPWYSYANQKWANAVILKNDYDELEKNGKVHGAKKESSYVNLDGIDDYIDLGLENQDFGTSVTFAMRLKINSTAFQYLLGNWEGAGLGIYYKDNEIKAQFYNTNTKGYEAIAANLLNMENYHTIVMTYDGNTLALYIDGLLAKSGTFVGSTKPSPVPILLGSNPGQDGKGFEGFSNIDVKNVAIYNRTLSAKEIKENFEGEMVVNPEEDLLSYQNFNKDYEEGKEIPEEEIESYFVWIPKYSYKIFDIGNYSSSTTIEKGKEQAISIKFGTTNTTDSKSGECTTPMNAEKTQGLSGDTKNCEVGDYMTHPAFISFGVNGLWVGKFAPGYENASTVTDAQKNENDSNKLEIKPNVYIWRNINIANAHQVSYNYKRDLDSHMMKNTEFGAVAYLSHSIYGTCTKEGCQEVKINNTNDYKTGYAATVNHTTGPTGTNESCSIYPNNCNEYGSSSSNINEAWNTPAGKLASTTQNISGIYDMNGPSRIYVMGFFEDETGNLMVGLSAANTSGFTGINGDNSQATGIELPEEKYYDMYKLKMQNLEYSQYFNYNKRILGDATGEMGPFQNITYKGTNNNVEAKTWAIGSWHNDMVSFPHIGNPCFLRGSTYSDGTGAGIFSLSRYDGIARPSVTFRVVLGTK